MCIPLKNILDEFKQNYLPGLNLTWKISRTILEIYGKTSDPLQPWLQTYHQQTTLDDHKIADQKST
jgi:hypothetical protein